MNRYVIASIVGMVLMGLGLGIYLVIGNKVTEDRCEVVTDGKGNPVKLESFTDSNKAGPEQITNDSTCNLFGKWEGSLYLSDYGFILYNEREYSLNLFNINGEITREIRLPDSTRDLYVNGTYTYFSTNTQIQQLDLNTQEFSKMADLNGVVLYVDRDSAYVRDSDSWPETTTLSKVDLVSQSTLWESTIKGDVIFTDLESNKIYTTCSGSDGHTLAVCEINDETGDKQITFQTDQDVIDQAFVTEDLFIVQTDRQITVYEKQSYEKKWEYKIPNSDFFDLATFGDSFFISTDRKYLSIDLYSGTINWEIELQHIQSRQFFLRDKIYLSNANGVYQIDQESGEVLSQFVPAGFRFGDSGYSFENKILVGGGNIFLYSKREDSYPSFYCFICDSNVYLLN